MTIIYNCLVAIEENIAGITICGRLPSIIRSR